MKKKKSCKKKKYQRSDTMKVLETGFQKLGFRETNISHCLLGKDDEYFYTDVFLYLYLQQPN